MARPRQTAQLEVSINDARPNLRQPLHEVEASIHFVPDQFQFGRSGLVERVHFVFSRFQFFLPILDECEGGGDIEVFMSCGVLHQVCAGEAEERGGGAQAVHAFAILGREMFLQMHKGAGELDEALVKIAVRSVSVGEPQFLEHIVGFVVKLAMKALKVAQVVRLQFAPAQAVNQRGYLRTFLAHAGSIRAWWRHAICG